ncbi:GNAT family N-acetyltransferase [Curtobacterium sp. VKM Ac-1393]|uniref:GNAT family N-acetyltransferase n=1 Tax=Curtobacterium sp. VKM Ac-1393 TaxID=2783814 RepID=UPI001889FFCC|nr:GNAT family N-acetyltransferase [Curtobacterium sp. VKM Ac-1393]MBF4609485.1 GNAT family N-acetyltransferase [Curtobacterium sp. VKM Ac-1393]
MIELVRPSAELFGAWTEAHREWGPGLHEDGFGIGAGDEVDTFEGFRTWIARTQQDSGELWWIVEDGEVLGGIALRSAADERVHRFGHIGYAIRPSARGRGVATWALGEVLRHAQSSGINPVLAFCVENNARSVATLEHHGAVLEAVEQHRDVQVRRYAIRH